MENTSYGRPRQEGGLGHVAPDTQLQQYLQGQKGNDFARRLRHRRLSAPR
jgi:hypothetical protein